MKTSPTQNSLKELRKTCQLVAVTEKWNPHARLRQDLFGIVDILAISGEETIAVQSTSWTNVSSRAKKMAESEALPHLRKAGWRILIHGWRKNPKSNRYELKTLDIS